MANEQVCFVLAMTLYFIKWCGIMREKMA